MNGFTNLTAERFALSHAFDDYDRFLMGVATDDGCPHTGVEPDDDADDDLDYDVEK